MCDVFNKYLQWNNALVDYYFEHPETSSVILYIDENIINSIGEKNGIELNDGSSYKDDFYRSVLLTLDLQRELLVSYRLHIAESKRENCHMKRWRSDDVFRFGALLAENPAPDIPCPALSYAIFAILAFQGENRNQWDNVEKVLKDHLPNMKLSPQYLKTIFESIEKKYPQFESGRLRGNQPYVGRIGYQLVLSASQRRDFGCQLVRWGICWDHSSDEGYIHFVQSKLLPRVSRDIRDRLKESENTPYFLSFLENFDPNDPSYAHKENEAVSASLFLYFPYKQGAEMMCGTSTYVTQSFSNEMLSIPKQNDSNFGLYPVFLRNNGQFSWPSYVRGDYSLNSSRFKFSKQSITKARKEYYLFYFKVSCGSYWVVQTDFPEDGAQCLIVTLSDAETTQLDLKQEIMETYLGNDANNYFSEWFNNWNVHIVQSWKLSAAEEKEKEKLLKGQDFTLNGGIRHPQSKTFFSIAPPHIFSEKRISSSEYQLRLDGEDLAINGTTEKDIHPLTSVTTNHYIIIKKDLGKRKTTVEYTARIKKVDDTGGDFLDLGSFMIEPARAPVDHVPFRYDGWGRPVSDDVENCISENARHGNQANKHVNPQSCPVFYKEPRGSFKLVNLLRSFFDECKYIEQDKLNSIIKEISLIEGYGTLDNDAIKEIRYALTDLGYMNRSYIDDQSVYQMNPAALVFTNKISRNAYVYMVYGSYSSEQLNTFFSKQLKNLIWYKNPYSSDLLEQKPYLQLLPDYVLLLSYAIIKENEQDGFPVVGKPFAYDILHNAASMKDFTRDFPFVVRNREQGDAPQGNNYPKITEHEGGCCIETRVGYITHYQREGTKYPIPHNLMKLYVRNYRRLPIFIVNGDDIYQTKDMGLPSLFTKAFCELSWETPKKLYAFGMYGCLGEEPLFSEIKLLCHMSSDMQNKMFEKLSGGRPVEQAILQMAGCRDYEMELHVLKSDNKPMAYELRLFKCSDRYNRRKLLAFTIYKNKQYSLYVNKGLYYYSQGNDYQFTLLSPANAFQNVNNTISELMDNRRDAVILSDSTRWDNDDKQPVPQVTPDVKIYPVKILRLTQNN